MDDILIAVVAGLAGTLVMTAMMLFGKQLKLPAVDAHGILGYMQYSDRPTMLGYVVHGINGVVFGIGYAIVFQNVAGNLILIGIVLGILHWLAVGWMFSLASLAHAGMKAGTVEETGAYMLKSLGFVGFVAGTVGHIVFGIVVAIVYDVLGGSVAV